MILRYAHLSRYPTVFKSMTGLTLDEFAGLLADLLPRYGPAEAARLSRRPRRRAIGAGNRFELAARDQFLLVVVWLRQYPTHVVLGYLFAVSPTTVSGTLARLLPLLAAAGEATFALPAVGRRSRRGLPELLADTPELAVIIDSFEQRVQRPKDRAEADAHYSGKKKQHTLKNQIAIDEQRGKVVDVSDSVVGPTSDLNLLRQSGLLGRLPPCVGALGDLAYVGMAADHPTGLAATPRRKPRDQPRPPADVQYNTAFARRRIGVEHSIGRLRRYRCLSDLDREHRRHHRARVCAVAGLVNRQIDRRFPC